MTGLYVHIPFCVKKCHYCDFVITNAGVPAKHETFLSVLYKEMAHTAPLFQGRIFDTLYIGGGTPSTLRAAETEKLFSMLRAHFNFKENAEVTFETNPGDVNGEKAGLYRNLGINRISLGAQSFNDRTLERINRCHDAEAISMSFQILRQAGFENINMDLILSLPDETLEDVKNSLNRLVKIGPAHVSLYELTIETKTVFGEEFKKGKLALPEEEEQLAMLSFAREYLKENGFRHYELLNYARPGFESRHNLIYWANAEYLGLGPGAFSYFGGRRFRNSASFEEYLSKINRGDWAAYEGETLSEEMKLVESFLLALRLVDGAELAKFERLALKLGEAIAGLEKKGLLIKDNEKIRLTPRGQFFAETVFTELSS